MFGSQAKVLASTFASVVQPATDRPVGESAFRLR